MLVAIRACDKYDSAVGDFHLAGKQFCIYNKIDGRERERDEKMMIFIRRLGLYTRSNYGIFLFRAKCNVEERERVVRGDKLRKLVISKFEALRAF